MSDAGCRRRVEVLESYFRCLFHLFSYSLTCLKLVGEYKTLPQQGHGHLKRELPINILEVKAVQQASNAFLDRMLGEAIVLMSGNATVVACLKKKRNSVSDHVQISTTDNSLVRISYGKHLCKIYFREE